MLLEHAEIYALLGRTKWTQIPRQEDQNQFQGLGDALAMFLWRFLVHDRTKKYKYNQCNKHFNQNINLKTHSLAHTGVKPQRCTHCKYSTNQGWIGLGWVGLRVLDISMIMPALRIVRWPSVLHLRKTAATSEEVIPTKYSLHCKNSLAGATLTVCICQGCQRFETSVFFSEKINISTTGGSRVGFFQPDTNHP